MAKKEYSALGQMIADGNFSKFIEELKKLQLDKKQIENLLIKTDGTSELDKMLYFIPKYSLDKNDQLKPDVLNAIDLLVAIGADPLAIHKSGITMFMQACQYSNKNFVEHICKIADIDITIGDGRSQRPLYYAVIGEKTEIIDFLVKDLNASIDFKMILMDNKTVFHCACLEMKEKSICKLMELNARPDIYDNHENLPAELIPNFDSELYDEAEKDVEFYDRCDNIFNILQQYYTEYKEKKLIKKPNL